MLLPEILPLHQTVIYVLTSWGQAVARIGSLVGPFSTNKMLTAYKRHFLDSFDIELFLRRIHLSLFSRCDFGFVKFMKKTACMSGLSAYRLLLLHVP